MKGNSTSNTPSPTPDPANLMPTDFSTNQEGKIVPWLAGSDGFAVVWLGPIYNEFNRPADSALPVKK